MAYLRIQLFFVAFLASLVIPSDCSRQLGPKTGPALFIFGDSLFDSGNNNYINTTTDFQANFTPYGESFSNTPPGAEYAKLPLIPSLLGTGHHQLSYGVNFTSGGAGALVETDSGLVITLKMQLNYYKHVVKQLRRNLGIEEAKLMLSNAVYLFSVGNNDYLFPLSTNSSLLQILGPEEYVDLVVGNVTSVIKQIYKKGGRKFGFLNLGPLGCLPSLRAQNAGNNGTCVEEVTALAKLHNEFLDKKLKQLDKKLKEFHYSFFDFFATAVAIFASPSKYGFKEVKSACCGTGPYRGIFSCGGKGEVKEYEVCDNAREHLFWDSYHPTEAANQQLAELMWNGFQNLTGPHNLKSLFQVKLF